MHWSSVVFLYLSRWVVWGRQQTRGASPRQTFATVMQIEFRNSAKKLRWHCWSPDYFQVRVICDIEAIVEKWPGPRLLPSKSPALTHQHILSFTFCLPNHITTPWHCTDCRSVTHASRHRNVIVIISIYSSMSDSRLNLNWLTPSDLPSSRATTKPQPFFTEHLFLFYFIYGPLFCVRLFISFSFAVIFLLSRFPPRE